MFAEPAGEQAGSLQVPQQGGSMIQELKGYESESEDESTYESESGTGTEYQSACESVEAESIDAESVEADFVEAESVEAESCEAESVEAESVEAESEAKSSVGDEDIPIKSKSAPAAISVALNIEAEAQGNSTGQASPSPPCTILSVSSQDEGTQETQCAQQEDATGEAPADLHLKLDSAKAIGGGVIVEQANGIGSSNELYISGLDSGEALWSKVQSAERKQQAAQQAPAVATTGHSKQSCLSGLIPSFRKMKRQSRPSAESAAFGPAAAVATTAGETAAIGPNSPDSNPHSSGNRKPLQKLKKLLSGKLRPNCMQASPTRTHSRQQEPTVLKGKPREGQQAPEQVQLVATCANVSTASEQQQQQPIPGTADGNKQHLTKLTGIFKPKRAASKPVVSANGEGRAPQSVQEAVPGDLIPAVRKAAGVAQQADARAHIATAEHAAKAATQVSLCALHAMLSTMLYRGNNVFFG